MVDTIYINQAVRIYARFEQEGVLTDPTEVTLKVQDPSLNDATYTYVAGSDITKASTGVFYYDLTIDEAGTWYYQYYGTGAVIAAFEGSFQVPSSQF